MSTLALAKKNNASTVTEAAGAVGTASASGDRADSGEKTRLFSNRDLFVLFLPLLIEQFLAFLAGLADSVMVASIGEAAVSAVSLVEFTMALLISLFSALATGGAVIAGQYLGKRQIHKAREAANQLVWFVGLVSLGVLLLISLGRPFILRALFGQVSAEVWNYANEYLTILAFAIPFIGLYSAGAAVFRTMGNSRLPMLIALLMSFMTVIGNALALYVLDAGVNGVAVSAVLARITGAVLIVVLALNRSLPLHFKKSARHTFRWGMIKRIMGIGVPYGLENGMFYLGRIVVLGLVATFGTSAIAANAVAGTIVLFEVLPGMAIGFGMTVVIARCAGAADYEQARYYNKKIIAVIYASHVVINTLVLLALPLVLDLYGLSEETNALAAQIVWWHAAFSVTIWPLAYSLPVTFRAAGDARYPMFVSIASMFACRIALAYILGGYFGMGVFGTWLAMFIDWIFKAILFAWRYCNGSWTRIRAI